MFNKFFVIFNDSASKDIDVEVIKRPNIPSPKRQYREYEVPGKSGKLYEDLGTYEDIEIEIEFGFLEYDPEQFAERFRRVKKWINNITDNKLVFSDDTSFFYLVNKLEIVETAREIKKVGKFTVNFNCEPFSYLREGEDGVILSTTDSILNSYEVAQPVYIVSGTGNFSITVNGKVFTANLGDDLVIDTKLGLTYRLDGTLSNSSVFGYYQDLFLKEGSNTFSFTSGFSVILIPNWRCL